MSSYTGHCCLLGSLDGNHCLCLSLQLKQEEREGNRECCNSGTENEGTAITIIISLRNR